MTEKQKQAEFKEAMEYIENEDFIPAFGLLTKLAKQNHVESIFQLAILYYFGRGTYTNHEKAKNLFQQIASKKHSEACLRLAWIEQIKIKQDEKFADDAIRYCKKAIDLGNDFAKITLNSLYHIRYSPEDIEEISMLKDVDSLYHEMYEDYSEMFKDSEKEQPSWSCTRVTDLCFRVANSGNLGAMVILGEFYMEGNGLQRDFSQAMEWFHYPAFFGDEDSLFHLATIMHQGKVEGNGKSCKASYSYAKAAIHFGSKEAVQSLKDIIQTVPRYQTAKGIQEGDFEAEILIEMIYESIEETEKKVKIGIKIEDEDIEDIKAQGLIN